MNVLKFALVALVSLFGNPCYGDGVVAAVNYATRDDVKGAEVEFGYQKTFTSWRLNIIPLSGIFYRKDDSRYREETFSNGQTVCRDTTNGQFADDDKCNQTGFDYGFIGGAEFLVTDRFHLGAGIRIGKETDIFAMAGYRVWERVSVQVKAGADYRSIGLFMNF
jgi:hypothetical protein